MWNIRNKIMNERKWAGQNRVGDKCKLLIQAKDKERCVLQCVEQV